MRESASTLYSAEDALDNDDDELAQLVANNIDDAVL